MTNADTISIDHGDKKNSNTVHNSFHGHKRKQGAKLKVMQLDIHIPFKRSIF